MKKIFLLFLLFSLSTVAYSWSFFSTPGSKEKVDPNQKKVDLSKYKEIVSCKKNMRWGAPKLKDMELEIIEYKRQLKENASISQRYEKYKINSDVLDLIQEHKPAEFKQLFNSAIAAADAEYSQKQQNNNYTPQNKPKALKL